MKQSVRDREARSARSAKQVRVSWELRRFGQRLIGLVKQLRAGCIDVGVSEPIVVSDCVRSSRECSREKSPVTGSHQDKACELLKAFEEQSRLPPMTVFDLVWACGGEVHDATTIMAPLRRPDVYGERTQEEVRKDLIKFLSSNQFGHFRR